MGFQYEGLVDFSDDAVLKSMQKQKAPKRRVDKAYVSRPDPRPAASALLQRFFSDTITPARSAPHDAPDVLALPALDEMLDNDPFMQHVLDETVSRMRFVA